MGQPVFLSDGQYSANQTYNQGPPMNQDFQNQGYPNNQMNQGYVVEVSTSANQNQFNYRQS